MRPQIRPQGGNRIFRKVRSYRLCQHEDFPRFGGHFVEEGPPGLGIGQIQPEPLQLASWCLSKKTTFLEIDEMGIIDFDPAKRAWHLHTVWPGVETGAQIQDR